MGKIVRAVPPYVHPGHLNFKYHAFEAWSANCGDNGIVASHYPVRCLHSLAFRYEFPFCLKSTKEARLMFVEPVSITFDTFPYYATHEVIPFIWDCWSCYYDKMQRWFKRHRIHTAIFTSRMEMEEMKRRCPEVNMLWCPEAVDGKRYKEGKQLKDRSINLLEFGRSNKRVLGELTIADHICTLVDGKFIYSNEKLYDAMGNAKITVCLPKSLTHPEIAQGIETLTQRYWEAMLSRMVIVGHAPQELIDICGYNPVIELPEDRDNINSMIHAIIDNIEKYQEMVDKNRMTALERGLWTTRMKNVAEWLGNSYIV